MHSMDLPDPLRLSRSELYERVWATPIIRLAEKFGITNFLLTGICRSHQIPTPPAGYWSKVAHDKALVRPSLPGDGAVLIDIGRAKIPGYRSSKAGARKLENRGVERVEPSVPTEAQAAPHTKVTKTVARLRAARGESLVRISGAGCFAVTASVRIADRVEAVLDRLVVKVEERGWHVKAIESRFELEIDGEMIGFELIEQTDRVAHQPTATESLAKARYEARVAQARKTGSYVSHWDAPRIPEWDYVPNGKLSLVLDEKARWRGVRRTFSDRKTQRVETLIDCIIESLAGYSIETKRKRVDDEIARVRSEEEARRREELRRLEQIDARRVEFADRQIVRLERLSRMEALILHLGDGELPNDTERFRDWLARHVNTLRSELEPDRLERRLAKTRLMHDDAVVSSWIDVETGGHRSMA